MMLAVVVLVYRRPLVPLGDLRVNTLNMPYISH